MRTKASWWALAVLAGAGVCRGEGGGPQIWAFHGGAEAGAYALSPDGMLAGGTTRLVPSGAVYAFRWSEGGGLALLGGAPAGMVEGRVLGASLAGGTLVGGNGGGGQAFRWSAGIYTPLGFLPGTTRSEANDVTPNGQAIVGWASTTVSNTERAWKWTSASGMTALGVPAGWSALGNAAAAVSQDGAYVAGWAIDPLGARRGVRWTPSGMHALELTGELGETFASGISADGQVVVGQAKTALGVREAFRWSEATGVQWLGDLVASNFESRAHAVSADGSVVVGQAGNQQAFLWDAAGGMRPLKSVLESAGLNLSGWTLSNAWAVSADGFTIAGEGFAPGFGSAVGFVAVIPGPGGAGVMVAWVVACGARRRRA